MQWMTASLVVTMLLAACGGAGERAGSDVQRSGSSSTTLVAAQGGAAPGGQPPLQGEAGASPGSGAAPGGDAGGSTPATPSEPAGGENPQLRTLPLTIEALTRCVRPGSTQTVVIKSEPTTDVGYEATYADGNSSWNPDHYGGSGKGITGLSGEFRDTFLVKPSAAAGPVTLGALAVNNGGYAKAETTFAIADPQGRC